MKQIIKHLAKDIAYVLEQNETANHMNALVDHGEWSQATPDFSKVVANWHLTRAQLEAFIAVAEGYSMLFNAKHPRRPGLPKGLPDYYTYDVNPWRQIVEILHYAFMAHNL